LTGENQKAHKKAGREARTRFWHQEEAEGGKPAYIEKDFAFNVGNNRVRGRFNRVDEDLLGAVIVDYKTSEVTKQKDADRRVGESLQLKMYALAWREMTGRLPQRVELRFLESPVTRRPRRDAPPDRPERAARRRRSRVGPDDDGDPRRVLRRGRRQPAAQRPRGTARIRRERDHGRRCAGRPLRAGDHRRRSRQLRAGGG